MRLAPAILGPLDGTESAASIFGNCAGSGEFLCESAEPQPEPCGGALGGGNLFGNWLVPATGAQLSYSAAVMSDKAVVERTPPSALSLASASSAVNLVVGLSLVAIVGFPDHSAFDVALALVAGSLLYLYLIPYFAALSSDDASSVGSLFQMVAPVTVAISWVTLGQVLHGVQWLGGVLMIAGAGLFVIGDGEKPWSVRARSALLMGLASVLVASSLVCLDHVLESVPYWQTLALECSGLGVTGATVASFRRLASGGTAQSLGKWSWLGIVLAELLALLGNSLQTLAIERGSADLVAVMVGTEPLFLLAFGILITRGFPRLFVERISIRGIATKLMATALILGGLALVGTVAG